ncbi:uncharacterized protein LOC128232848 isoform X3 [Mya arenaria]|uniref:uncharacterized protein LOC128232848 isoform X3 n=1 Tax=Mya arenaria TaxID=6604 RepID=UPI0022E75F05|nr:uncharacterized protein LOC128232848 isoform X3 [Mya arenaria]
MNINVQRKMDSPLHKWLVLLSAVMVMSVDISLTHNTGQIFVAVMDRFNSNRAQTAVIQSTLIAVLFATGLLHGIAAHKYGPLMVGLWGGFVMVVGMIASVFAKSVTHLVVTFVAPIVTSSISKLLYIYLYVMVNTVLCQMKRNNIKPIFVYCYKGIGTSALLLTAMTAAGQHWEGNSHRPIVLSLISAGSGLGGTIYLYLITTLKENYGLPGVFLVCWNICQHICYRSPLEAT